MVLQKQAFSDAGKIFFFLKKKKKNYLQDLTLKKKKTFHFNHF